MHTYDTPAPVTAVAGLPAGNITFIAADRADTTVEVRPADASSSRDIKAAEQTQVGYGDGVLRIQAPPARNRVLGHPGSVQVTVQLPADSGIEATAASARVRGVGRLGHVTIDAAQATVKIDEAAAAQITVQAGDITIGRLAGAASISTRMGTITVTEAVTGTVELSAQDGAITIGAAAGACAALDAGTSYGRIRNALTSTGGTPALTIHATTGRGDITARSL